MRGRLTPLPALWKKKGFAMSQRQIEELLSQQADRLIAGQLEGLGCDCRCR